MANGKILTSIMDTLAVCSNIIESADSEVSILSPPSLLVLSSKFGLRESTKMLILKEASVRCIADFSYQYIEELRELLDYGIDVRHAPQYRGIFMLVGDRRESISSMSIDVENLSIDAHLVALWSDDSTYAEYLLSTFKIVWEQAIPGAQQLEELLKDGPPNI